MDRRELLLATAAALWAGTLAEARSAPRAHDRLLDALCDLVIPDTDTPGARRAGVPLWLPSAMKHGLAGWRATDRAALEAELDAAAGGHFLALDAAGRARACEAVDTAAYAKGSTSPWPRFKTLVLMGYYSSEAGASQELQYQLIPGRFDPDVHVAPGDRAWSSDWMTRGF